LRTSYLFDIPLKNTGNQAELNMVTDIADGDGLDKKHVLNICKNWYVHRTEDIAVNF
jgi:hypothetical protein